MTDTMTVTVPVAVIVGVTILVRFYWTVFSRMLL
jgi:cbb3-type cytochrome oxidase maturation protein